MRKWSGHDRNHGMIRMIEPAGRGRPRQSTDEMLGRCRDPFIARRDPKHDRAQFVKSASIAILPEGGGLRPAVGREIDLSLDQPLRRTLSIRDRMAKASRQSADGCPAAWCPARPPELRSTLLILRRRVQRTSFRRMLD